METAVLSIDTNRVRPFAEQPREYFDPGELLSLELSIKQRGQLQPAMVRLLTDDKDHDYELVDGQRRWHACIKLGVPFRAVLVDPEDEEDQFEISVAANFQRAGHTPMEIAKAIDRMITQGERTIGYVGTIFGKTDPWVVSYRSLNNLVPEIQAQLEPAIKEPMPISVASNLARLPKDQQLSVYEQIKSRGLTSVRAVDLIRRILLDGAPESRNPHRGTDKGDRRIRQYVRRTIQTADHLFDRMGADDFPAIVKTLLKNKQYDELKENVMTAIGRLETLHRRLVECRVTLAASAKTIDSPVEPQRSKAAPKSDFVFSHPMKCPKCNTTGTRFKRRTDANVAKDSWVCETKGCLLKISNYNIKVDRNHSAAAAAGA